MGVPVESLLAAARRRLAAAPFRPATREAALLLGRVLGLGEAQVLARSRELVEDADAARFENLLQRRLGGEPVAYLLGEREFYGRLFQVDRRVLVPRPETEHLVERALALDLPPAPHLLDVGTGSGCIAITLALEIAGARVTATDLAPAALALAAANVCRHGVSGCVHPVAADLARGIALAGFDLAVSNPPYVDPAVAPTLSTEVRDHEPAGALFAPGGDAVLARLLAELEELSTRTPLLLEIGHDQGERLRELAAGSAFELLAVERDYAGRTRVAVLRRR